MSGAELEMFVIYKNPSDYPGKFVVRRWVVRPRVGETADAAPLAVTSTLEAARFALPPGAYNLGRYSEDDPAVCEVWV